MYRTLLIAASLLSACISPVPSVPAEEEDSGFGTEDATQPADASSTLDAMSGDVGDIGDIGGADSGPVDSGPADIGPDIGPCDEANQIVRAQRCVQLVDSSYVVSVTPIEATIADGLVEAIANTNAFAASNSVPFFTKSANNTVDIPTNFQPDIWLSADGQVTAKRAGVVGNLTISGSVVEFDPAEVRVQSGTFSTVDTTATVNIDAVDRGTAFLIFHYLSTGLSDLKRQVDLAGRFVDDQTIEFYRNGTDGTLEGHWYVVEALNGAFEVQHLPATTFDTAATSVTAPRRFAPEASFSIFSHASNIDTDDLALSQLACTTESGSAVECARNGALYEVQELQTQVVTLNGIDQSVEHGEITIGPAVPEERATLSTPATRATAWGGYTGKPGATHTNTVSSSRTPGSFVALSLSDDGAEVIARRGSPNDELGLTYDNLEYVLRPRFQVIRW